MSEHEKYTPPETEKKITSLKDLLDPQQDASRYADLIGRQEHELTRGNFAVLNSTEYSERWNFLVSQSAEKYLQFKDVYAREEYETLDRLFREHLQGAVLIELGSGSGYYVEQIAHKYKMGTYIRVDRDSGHKYSELRPDPQIAIEDVQIEDLQRISVKADMLDFVARLRPNTANFTLNGIDRIIIDNVKYHEALVQEILRVAQSGSLIFGVDSHALEILSEHSETKNSGLKEHPVDALPEMSIGRGHVFEVVK